MGLSPLRHQTPRFIFVVWEPLPFNWVKINTDGSFRDPSHAGFGGIFRNAMHSFLGAFTRKVTVTNALEAEVYAVIEAIRVAWLKGWKHLWLETDSSLVVHYFNSPNLIPWHFRTSWANCLHITKQMAFHVSHVYREGNSVADKLANYGVEHVGSHWWDFIPHFLVVSYGHDISSRATYRFR